MVASILYLKVALTLVVGLVLEALVDGGTYRTRPGGGASRRRP